MKKNYLVWKDPVATQKDWQQMSRDEFKSFAKSPEANNLYFMRLNGADGDDAIPTVGALYKQGHHPRRVCKSLFKISIAAVF